MGDNIITDKDRDLPIQELVTLFLGKIDQLREREAKPVFTISKPEKQKFNDKFPMFSTNLRQPFHEIINILTTRSGWKKHEVVELLLYTGLKNLHYEE